MLSTVVGVSAEDGSEGEIGLVFEINVPGSNLEPGKGMRETVYWVISASAATWCRATGPARRATA